MSVSLAQGAAHSGGFDVTNTLATGRKFIPECESVRGIAIFLVFIQHFGLEYTGTGPLDVPLWLAFVYLGGTAGVCLFFVLSAFLLTLPFLRHPEYEIRGFYRNRILRIMPLYLLMVLVASIVKDDYGAGLLAALFLKTDIQTLFPFGAVWWSLAVEVQFYLALPLVFKLIVWPGRRIAGLLLLVIMGVVYSRLLPADSIIQDHGARANAFSSLLGLWPVFLVGGLYAHFYLRYGDRLRDSLARHAWLRNGASDLLMLVLIFLLATLFQFLASVGLINTHIDWFCHYLVQSIVWGGLIFMLLLFPLRLKFLLVNPLFHYLGVISYSVYLVHGPVFWYLGGPVKRLTASIAEAGVGLPASALALALLAVLTLAIGTCTYRLIERPFMLLKRRKNFGA